MDRLTALLLRLTPDERLDIARRVAARISSADDDEVEATWLDCLREHFARLRTVGGADDTLPLHPLDEP
jgi:hypothetical protein